jgi:hypothetical protein
MMLASVTPWRVGFAVDGSQFLKVEPALRAEMLASPANGIFGVDVYSTQFANVSNHPIMFGATSRTKQSIRGDLLGFDRLVQESAVRQGTVNPSIWVGIGATVGTGQPNGLTYKYPLGTAQLLLAVLEASRCEPRFFDRQYLPWLVANCDGGLETIRNYPWNVEMWWSCMAAAVGPSSQSEAIFRLASGQRPTEIVDVDRRLRYEYEAASTYLNSKWNLTTTSNEALSQIVGLIRDLSGWPDPFIGGVESFADWRVSEPTRNLLKIGGFTRLDPTIIRGHIAGATEAIHANVSTFRERGVCLGWMLSKEDEELAETLGPPPDVAEEAGAEETIREEASEMDLGSEDDDDRGGGDPPALDFST